MEIHVSGRTGLASQIYRQVRSAVLGGRLRPGEQVPSTRELAARLGISRTTVGVAYDRLTAEGFLVGRVGAGTFVGRVLLKDRFPPESPGPQRGGVPLKGGVPPKGRRGADVADAGEPGAEPDTGVVPYDFRIGFPDPGLFPLGAWRRLVAGALRTSVFAPGAYDDPAGVPALRAAIAHHVGVARAVPAAAGDVVVTSGAQQALDLIGRVLLAPGDLVAVEEPGYPAARALWTAAGARAAGVPVDADGLVVDALPDDARLVYVTPSHQFPLGVPLSLSRRVALLRWADRRGAIVVEDDYDSEFRYADRPLEPLRSLDPDGRVVYVGSFAKTLSPALRLGFLVAPRTLRPALVTARRLADRHGDPVTQHALARFLDEGLLARHVRRATRVYAARYRELVAGIDRDFAGTLERVPSAAGLHLCARARTADVEALVGAAARRGVRVGRLADHGGPDDGLVFGFGLIAAERVAAGLAALR